MASPALSERNKLHLIKASAGSGKTHRLTGDYLRLLFGSPNHYRHILAVTFTNKATDEMKSRIVKELHKLESGQKSDYLSQLTDEFSLSETKVRTQAKTILESILHDYSSFSISTIDRFFQQTMRAFTREMGLSGGYNVEVDDSAFLPEIIDKMIFELDKPENEELAKWLLLFMKDKIENSKGWSIKDDIVGLASEIFNETYKSLPQEERDKIHDKAFLEEYKKTLIVIVKAFESKLKVIGERAVNLMDNHNLHPQDFKWGKTSGFSFFARLTNGEVSLPTNRFVNLADNLEEWKAKKTPVDKIIAIDNAYSSGMNDCVKEILSVFETYETYNSARIVLNYFYTLGILNDVQRRLQEFQQENNTLFLSDTTELLNKIIGDSDAPFVYEKTGTRIHNYMIDEFQDTSAMQWGNFKPLVQESLSANNFNLIVGDVKQSIYRWRNSDWRLLEEQVPRDFRSESVQHHSLETNWRSDEQVIRFNNAFFGLGAQRLQTEYNQTIGALPDNDFKHYVSSKIEDAYAQVKQHVPPQKADGNGQIRISFLKESETASDWRTQALEQLPKDIEQLQDQGFALKDIAIVVRKNKEAVEIAETLLKYKDEHPHSRYRYDIISNEALVIGNAQSVKAVIALLRYFRNRNDRTKRMLAVYEFYRFHHKYLPDLALQAFLGKENDVDFPDEVNLYLDSISTLPLYELIESFFLFSKDALDEKENAYVQAFLDIALKFSTNSSGDMNSFLDWWDEKGYRKALFSPDNQDAIRLISIHKSKGLGFGAVLMPFVDWEFDHTRNDTIIWCRPKVEPFSALSIVPLRYSKSLMDSIFRDDYLQEKLFSYIDNLNLLYVAFTRAKKSIIAYAPFPKESKNNPIKTVADLLWQTVSNTSTLSESADSDLQKYLSDNDDVAVFEMGKPHRLTKAESSSSSETVYKTGKWQSVPFGNRLKMRLNSIGYFSDDGSREYGTLMHAILSNVETADDIDVAVEKAVSEGEIPIGEKADLLTSLKAHLSVSEAANWYSGKYRILNEVQILHPKFGFSRPDRVRMDADRNVIVVDYKFGNLEETKYIPQVKRYVKYIEEMGYARVKGFVFYVKLNKVVSCEV